MTNGDRIRNMTDEELAVIIMCPYDTAGDPIDIMPCIKDGGVQELVDEKTCRRCCIAWLKRNAEEQKQESSYKVLPGQMSLIEAGGEAGAMR